jgi:hypothetical protein
MELLPELPLLPTSLAAHKAWLQQVQQDSLLLRLHLLDVLLIRPLLAVANSTENQVGST